MYADLLNQKYIDFIVKNTENFGKDDLITDAVIEKYGLKCLNDCSDNGICIKSN